MKSTRSSPATCVAAGNLIDVVVGPGRNVAETGMDDSFSHTGGRGESDVMPGVSKGRANGTSG
jgi:hypothetical protein